MNEKPEGVLRTTDAQIDAAFKEEHEAALEFAKITRKETQIQADKEKCRYRLERARDAKRELLSDLMAL